MRRRRFVALLAAAPVAACAPLAPAAPLPSGLTVEKLLAARALLDAAEVADPYYVWANGRVIELIDTFTEETALC